MLTFIPELYFTQKTQQESSIHLVLQFINENLVITFIILYILWSTRTRSI